MENINDYYRYTQLMRNGFYDKQFWIDKLFYKWETFVDYGCSDGFQTKMIAQIFPDKRIVGYDADQEMLNRAIYSGPMPANVSFTNNEESILNCDVAFYSSVIHEIHSYKSAEEVGRFWVDAFNSNRKYVIIRDMMTEGHSGAYQPVLEKLTGNITSYCEKMNVMGEYNRFFDIFKTGNNATEVRKSLIHFMLKMPYINSPNWNREIYENYLPVTMEKIINIPKPAGWELEYKEAYTLPYLKYWWKENVGIDMPFTTHGKLIFHNKNK